MEENWIERDNNLLFFGYVASKRKNEEGDREGRVRMMEWMIVETMTLILIRFLVDFGVLVIIRRLNKYNGNILKLWSMCRFCVRYWSIMRHGRGNKS